MELAVGDVVVYGTHGIGRITAREQREVQGTMQDVVVLALEDGLTASLPLQRAADHLRPLASAAVLRRVGETLRDDCALSLDPWLSRRRVVLEKLAGGDPVDLAEIVSEGAQRERARKAGGGRGQGSQGERELFGKARRLLAGEVALALGIQPDAADGWIDEHLARPA